MSATIKLPKITKIPEKGRTLAFACYSGNVQLAEENLEYYLDSLDWSFPWDAGAQYSSFCVYSVTQNFDINENLVNFINKKVDRNTGSYFDKKPTTTRQIIKTENIKRPKHRPESIFFNEN